MYVKMGRGDKRSRTNRVPSVIGGLLIAALALTACSSGGDNNAAPTGTGNQGEPKSDGNQQVAPASAKPAAAVKFAPGADAKDVSPSEPVSVSVSDGTIEAVTLTNPEGKQVKGNLSADKTSWAVAEHLGFAKTYTWSGSAVGADGKSTPIAGAFTTVKPKRQVRGTINTGDGQTYGIAMPIAVTFDAAVTDRAAVQKALKVETSTPTEGAWAWLSDRSVHWRPKAYWKPGTKVTVTANLYGLPYGNGSFGKDDVSSSFTIGRSQVVKANTQTHRWVVFRDGAQAADYAASFGLESDPGRVTKSGTHVVMTKHADYLMTNPRYDYEDFPVKWAVRISNNGEFSHAAPWSVGDQGKRNVSHGCANLSPANAKAYYDSAMMGDPVEIEGSNQRLSAKDGDYYDWAFSWDQWLAKSANS
jgi:lipoprotein-anchoring transpeptidase ErfK/SrfK